MCCGIKSVEGGGRRIDKIFGEKLPYAIVDTIINSIDWFFKNKKNILRAKKEIPKVFDFKPEDVFSNKRLLLKCLRGAPKRIKKIF